MTRRSWLPGNSDWLVIGVACVLLVAIVWIVFHQTIRYGFVTYDDDRYIYGNPRVLRGLTWGNIQWAFIHFHAGNWHPLTTISHMLDCQFYGLQPSGHHLTNVLLHAAVAVLLFVALRELTKTDLANVVAAPPGEASPMAHRAVTTMSWPSAFVAALFAVHPLRVESVAWISERKDVLSGVFFMLTLLAYAGYARSGRFSLGRYTAVLVFFACGLMCKPTLTTVPFVLLLLDYWPLGRWQAATGNGQRVDWSAICYLLVEKLPLFVLSAASCVVTVLAQKPAFAPPQLTFLERLANAVVSYVAYLGQMIYPAHLAVMYPYGKVKIAEVMLALFLVVTVSAVFFVSRKKYPFLLMGWLWFLGMLVPMIGLVQVGLQARADRYTYLPQIGLYIAATWGAVKLFAKWRRGREFLVAVAALVITGLAMRSHYQNLYWQNSETLWRHTIEVTADNYIAHNNLANSLLLKGQVDEAIAESQTALTIAESQTGLAVKPELANAEATLGNSLLRKGDIANAVAHYQSALASKPDFAEVHNNLGIIFFEQGRADDAIAHYRKALESKPDYALAHSNLGQALLQKDHVDEAIAECRKALEIAPGLAEAHGNLGNVLLLKGEVNDAIAHYQKAVQLNPNYAKVRNNLGIALESVGKSDEALEQFSEALRINAEYPEAHYNLGCVLAQRGRRDEAVAHLSEALRLKPDHQKARKQLRALGIPAPSP